MADNKEDYKLDDEFALDDSEDDSTEPARLPGTSNVESSRGRLSSFFRVRRGSNIPASEPRPRQGSMTSNMTLVPQAPIHVSGTERRMSHSNRDDIEAHGVLATMPSLLKSEHTLSTRRMSRTTQIMNEEMNPISTPERSHGFKSDGLGLETVPQTPATEIVAFEVGEVLDHRATGKMASWRGGIILVCISPHDPTYLSPDVFSIRRQHALPSSLIIHG